MDSTGVFGTSSLSSNLSRTAKLKRGMMKLFKILIPIFVLFFSSSVFAELPISLYKRSRGEMDITRVFGIGGISISLVLQSNLSKYF